MSYRIGFDVLRRQRTERPAHTEFCNNWQLVRELTGRDPRIDTDGWAEFYDLWQMDLLWQPGFAPPHAPWVRSQEWPRRRTQRRPWPPRSTFHTVEDVYAFDPLETFAEPEPGALLEDFEAYHRREQETFVNQVCPGRVSGLILRPAIQTFGRELLEKAAADLGRLDAVLEGFFRVNRLRLRAWADSSAEAIIVAEDVVGPGGNPLLPPEFMQDSVFPRYRALLSLLTKRAKRPLFWPTGACGPFMHDLAAAGVAGFVLEPQGDFDEAVRKLGKTHVLMGSRVRREDLAAGARQKIRRQIDSTLDLTANCPGFVFTVPGGLPAEAAVDDLEFYYEYLSSNWYR